MRLTQCVRGGSQEGRPGYLLWFYYDQDFIESLKQSIPHMEREWREGSKCWWVSGDYENELKRLFSNFEALVYMQGTLF